MDPFTKRMLEKAERRSRALGISNTASAISQLPLNECATDSITNSNISTINEESKDESCATTPEQVKQNQQIKLHSLHSSTGNKSKDKLQVVEKNSRDLVKESEKQQCVDSIPKKILRQFSAVDKDNIDLGIEINVTTYDNVEVQIQVEEEDETNYNNNTDCYDRLLQKQCSDHESVNKLQEQQSVAYLRDVSRRRLQGLSTLYSNTAEISSPIHCTEGQFHTESNNDNNDINENVLEKENNDITKKQVRQCRLGKLSALASTINQWENDTNHYNIHAKCAEIEQPLLKEQQKEWQQPKTPPPKPNLPSRGRLNNALITSGTNEKKAITTTTKIIDTNVNTDSQNKTKYLNWDSKVINSLEAQGFQRRDSSIVKVLYDFNDEQQLRQQQNLHSSMFDEEKLLSLKEYDSTCKTQRTTTTTTTTTLTTTTTTSSNDQNIENEKCAQNVERKLKTSFVANRAAIFESKVNKQQQHQLEQQKDPAELSVKERMQLFEKNKGTGPLMPKAAFGMSAPISELIRDKPQQQQVTNVPLSKINADSKVRDKMTSLMNAVNENRGMDDLRKQREEDMQLLTERFNKQKEAFACKQEHEQKLLQKPLQEVSSDQVSAAIASDNQHVKSLVPVPPPPPPTLLAPAPSTTRLPSVLDSKSDALLASTIQHNAHYTKRRSSGNTVDETKRARKCNSNHSASCNATLNYDSNESDDEYTDSTTTNNCCTTATVTADEMKEGNKITNISPIRKGGKPTTEGSNQYQQNRQSDHKDIYEAADEDSYMDVEDESEEDDSSDECATQNNVKQRKQHQQVPQNKNMHKGSLQLDEYLDEALGQEERNKSHLSKNIPLNQMQTFEDNDNPHKNATTSPSSISSTATITTTTSSTNNSSNALCNIHNSLSSPSSSFLHPVKSELSVNKENDNLVTLVHTVSFYRRQQGTNSANSTPVGKVAREEQVSRSALQKFQNYDRNYSNDDDNDIDDTPYHPDPSFHGKSLKFNESIPEIIEHNNDDNDCKNDNDDDEKKNNRKVQEKIERLLDEVCKQQQIIAQTSQALNLCASTIEFSGSTESVEGERHLLVATHRRQACLDEIQRLRVEKAIRPLGAPREKGRLTIKEIALPLRPDYIQKLKQKTISGHHLVCLVKYNEHVLATKSVATSPDNLAVQFSDVLHLHDAYADFKVTIEVYGMTAQCEILPHEVKYHINTHKKSGIKTPKKKGLENPLVMPPEQSATGPRVIRTPALVQYAFALFSIKEIRRTNWTLTQVLGISPLEGVLHMKLNCELSIIVEHKGFLTMFEDVSGFGAWNRRWCSLNGSVINYWKYPEDEKMKAPIGSIDLYTCCVQKVALAPRDICARLNTMLLECQRPAEQNDKPSLVIRPNGRTTIVRHLLSADTKEEREEWCAFLNKTLTLLRAWGPPLQ